MSFFITKGSNLLDEISDPGTLCRLRPSFVDFFDALDAVRDATFEARQIIAGRERVGMTNDGTMMRMSVVPANVWAALKAIEPNLTKDRKTYYRWLNRNPQFRVGYVKMKAVH